MAVQSCNASREDSISPTPPEATPEKKEAYYCANFKRIINFVNESIDGHVISKSEVAKVHQFLKLQSKFIQTREHNNSCNKHHHTVAIIK